MKCISENFGYALLSLRFMKSSLEEMIVNGLFRVPGFFIGGVCLPVHDFKYNSNSVVIIIKQRSNQFSVLKCLLQGAVEHKVN